MTLEKVSYSLIYSQIDECERCSTLVWYVISQYCCVYRHYMYHHTSLLHRVKPDPLCDCHSQLYVQHCYLQ